MQLIPESRYLGECSSMFSHTISIFSSISRYLKHLEKRLGLKETTFIHVSLVHYHYRSFLSALPTAYIYVSFIFLWVYYVSINYLIVISTDSAIREVENSWKTVKGPLPVIRNNQ
jgi:hypothetical protein